MTAAALHVADLLAALDAGEPLLLLDVRNEREFAAWRVEGSLPVETLNVPYFSFLEEPDPILARLPRDRPIVAVCAQGGSSAMVVELLRGAGLEAWNLEGGMAAYADHLEPARVRLGCGDALRLEVWQVRRRARGCLSYVVRVGTRAAVVDPSRHVAWYEGFVERLGARIALVLDTHVHADHLSGGRALAKRSRAPYAVGAGDDLPTDLCEALALRALATPGHTPEGRSLVCGSTCLLSGDTLLVDGVGRPDLGGEALAWGRELHRTLHVRLAALDDDLLVLPAHSAGNTETDSDGIVGRTLGALRRLPELRLEPADAFATAVAARVVPAPPSYACIARANREGTSVPDDVAAAWETGPNHCAAASRTPGAHREHP